MAPDARIRRYRANWQSEIDSAFLYEAMAQAEQDASIARVYRQLGDTEAKHATFWYSRLRELGIEAGAVRPSWRALILAWSAKSLGPRSVLGIVASAEHAGRNVYVGQPETTSTKMTAEEHTHALVLQSMLQTRKGAKGSELASLESRHRRIGGNALRAAVLGANDGLCSNLSLVMGVAGASSNNHTILVGGMAGLLAGACSMALGEWVSVTSSRELAERELRIERDELAVAPEEERAELQLIYEAKGLPTQEASELSKKLVGDERAAVQVLAREELGINPESAGQLRAGGGHQLLPPLRRWRGRPGPALRLSQWTRRTPCEPGRFERRPLRLWRRDHRLHGSAHLDLRRPPAPPGSRRGRHHVWRRHGFSLNRRGLDRRPDAGAVTMMA